MGGTFHEGRRVVARLALLFVLFLFCCASARAQEYVDFFRGDEVGPRDLYLDEEGFLNILSFEQPLETIQPWLSTSSGYRGALGSLTASVLWLEQDLKVTAPVSDRFRVCAYARQAVDFDSSYVFVEPVLEYRLTEKHSVLAPFTLDADKGNIGGGAGWRYRDPGAGIEYLQCTWVRSNAVFNERSRRYENSSVRDPPDSLEVQAQGSPLDMGTTSLKVAYQLHGKIKYEELGRSEEFRRFSAWLLHRYDLNDLNRLFFEFDQDSAGEQVSPFQPEAAAEEFRGDRDFCRARLEYQKDLDDDGIRRVRGGVQYLRFREDEFTPADREKIHRIQRRESILYAGYRSPFRGSETLSLETVVYLDWLSNHNRFPYDPGEDGRPDPFQGKISFYFRWAVSDDVDFVLDPSFELDTIGWGGGGIMLRCRF